MSSNLRTPLFAGAIATGATQYVGVPIVAGALGCQIAWLDAISAATITLEFTSYDHQSAPVAAAGAAHKWRDSGLVITGPSGAAAGSTLVNVDGIRQRRGRIKITATANCSIEVLGGWGGP
jgi:hypothetical protein